MKKVIIFILLLSGLCAYSQKADFIIKVKDAATGEYLAGATVNVQGVGFFTSDFDGNITINEMKQGTYKLSCESFSYANKVFTEIRILSGEVNSITIEMEDISTLTENGMFSSNSPVGKASK